jgi:hypothetical protein
MKRWIDSYVSGLFVIGAIIALTATATAQSSSSTYRVDEYFFGTGGELNACSGAYCSKLAAGETTVGSTESDAYLAQAGFNTTDVPLLEVAVNGSVDFGVLGRSTTGTGTATVQVRTFLASGYVMRIVGDPLSYTTGGNTHVLASPNAPTASATGTEQFGINLRANTNPTNFGANPVQVPDDTFSFGQPETNYDTPNLYMYQSNSAVASSNQSSGQTNYTISMIVNISDVTPAGKYTGALSVVVTSTF